MERRYWTLVLALLFISCATQVPKYDKVEQLQIHEEFEKVVKIEAVPEVSPDATPTPPPKFKAKEKKQSKKSKQKVEEVPTRRQPELESDVGFNGRRPLKDPFRVGEKITHSVRYFKVAAGSLILEVKPLVIVNGKKSYSFQTSIKSSSFFNSFYSVDDTVETLVDFETLVPNVFTLRVKESGQLKDAKSFFDHDKGQAFYWEKKVTEKSGVEEKKKDWELAAYSQNVFSAAFYMRNFTWVVGEENAFRVSDDGSNLVFRGKAVRQEKLETDVGVFDAIVIKPQIELKGKFQPVGDIYIWLSNDERKYILRIESAIKIGTLVSEIIELAPGRP